MTFLWKQELAEQGIRFLTGRLALLNTQSPLLSLLAVLWLPRACVRRGAFVSAGTGKAPEPNPSAPVLPSRGLSSPVSSAPTGLCFATAEEEAGLLLRSFTAPGVDCNVLSDCVPNNE